MNPHAPLRPSGRETIEATAAAWLAQRDGGLTPEEAESFAQWRRADPRHEAAVSRLERAWGALQQLRDFRPEARMHPDRDLLRPNAARRVTMFPAAATLAAAAAVVFAVAWWITQPAPAVRELRPYYATTVDGYERVTLADGSVMELNADSEARVLFSAEERTVRLLRGEAHFTVIRDSARPFLVDAGAVAVRALGTAFNVRLGVTDVEVLVTQGSVEVKQTALQPAAPPHRGTSLPSASPVPAPASSGTTVLRASERALIPIARLGVVPPAVETVAPAVLREALAWQGPRLVFDETPLAGAVAQFNRRSQVQLIVADPDLEALPIGGSFRAENVEAFVRLLESDNDIVVERPDATRIILRLRK
jgi:transmembrane sensor